MPSEIFSRGGAEPILRHLPSALVRTLMRFPMPANTTVSLEFWADSKQFARCSGADSAPRTRLNFSYSPTEEPTRFGIGCLGSRLLSGTLSADAAGKLKDGDGRNGGRSSPESGFNGNLQDVKLAKGYYKGFVELHIEQGPLLERARTSLGIVKSIAAPASLRISIAGAGGHAGGMLMADRKDALCAAAELILVVENAARTSGAADTVATVGVCDVFPGAVNSIPSRVRITLDVRDTDLTRRDAVMQTIERASHNIAVERHVSIQSEILKR